jgi:hypothetical protein
MQAWIRESIDKTNWAKKVKIRQQQAQAQMRESADRKKLNKVNGQITELMQVYFFISSFFFFFIYIKKFGIGIFSFFLLAFASLSFASMF